ncbi:hypothetical protein [Kurthia zopfii]|uniref:hypothetical protein n=1 Tax=Kurthia zopfii TaxID=1650 RepID=UPI000F70256A|nr:hypothetical protein [Kurthia zopfii]VEI05273.1 Uncharacterised protein [Kurthia zopfii]
MNNKNSFIMSMTFLVTSGILYGMERIAFYYQMVNLDGEIEMNIFFRNPFIIVFLALSVMLLIVFIISNRNNSLIKKYVV